MSEAELDQRIEAYVGTLAEHLKRPLVVQRLWLSRWRGEPPPSVDGAPAYFETR